MKLFISLVLCFIFCLPLQAQNEEKIKQRVKELKEKLQSKEKDVRGEAANSLSQIGPAAKMVIPDLSALYGGEKNAWVRQMTLKALWKIGAEYKSAHKVILKALKKDSNKEVKILAIEICGHIGKRMGDEVLPYLLSFAKSPEYKIKVAALKALIKMGKLPPDGASVVVEIMENERDGQVISFCSEILGNSGSGKGVVPNLIVALKREQNRVRIAAARALGKIGEDSKSVFPYFYKYLKIRDEDLVLAVILAIRDYGPKGDKKAGTYLKKFTTKRGASEELKKAAIEAIGRLGPLASKSLEKSLEGLVKRYKKKEPYLSRVSEKALENMRYLKNQKALENVDRILDVFASGEDKEVQKSREEMSTLGLVILPKLAEALREEDRLGKEHICLVIKGMELTSEHMNVLQAVAETAIYSEAEVKVVALKTLAKFGKLVKDLLPYIVDGLNSEHDIVRTAAAETLGLLGGETAGNGIESLTFALKDAESTVRMAAIVALGKMKASSAKKAIEEAIKEETDAKIKEKMESVLKRL